MPLEDIWLITKYRPSASEQNRELDLGGERKEKFAARKSECLAAGPMMLHRFAGATKPVCSEQKKAPDHPPAAFGLRSSVAG